MVQNSSLDPRVYSRGEVPTKLGAPLPDSPHAVSASLPKLRDVIGYEKGRESTKSAFVQGYPRFVVHPLVKTLIDQAAREIGVERGRCLVLPSKWASEQCVEFIRRNGDRSVSSKPLDRGGLYAVTFSEISAQHAKSFWQHTGEIVSSRQAESYLTGVTIGSSVVEQSKASLVDRLSEWYQVPSSHITLTPSGMSSFFRVYGGVREVRPFGQTFQLGFPYIDSFKVQEKWSSLFDGSGIGPGLLTNLIDVPVLLNSHLGRANSTISGIFLELPTNPLLGSVNLEKVSRIAKSRGIPIVVDDTIGTVHNIDALRYADIVISSLTKFVSGQGDVMAGAIIFNPRSAIADEIRARVLGFGDSGIFGRDIVLLEESSRDFAARMDRINTNTNELVEFLTRETFRGQPILSEIYHPSVTDTVNYEHLMKEGGGYGGLLSLVLNGDSFQFRKFYDNIEIAKGPSLGTNFSLMCPYTLLAHWGELDWAEECGVSRKLLRMSVGLEDSSDIVNRFISALSISSTAARVSL